MNDLTVYKEAVFYADTFNSLSKRFGQGNALTVRDAYEMLANNPNSLKLARQNRLYSERRAKKTNSSQAKTTR